MMKKRTAIGLGGLTIIIYLLTVSRFLPWGDGSEFYLAAKNLGIPHSSGYPLFLIIGRMLLSLSPRPFMLNILPAVFTTIAVIFLYLIILKLTRDQMAAIALSLFFGFGRIVWLQSIIAEVYTLNLLFLILILYCALRIEDGERFTALTFYLSGLALTNHLTSIFYIIPVLGYIYYKKKRIGYYSILALIPLSLYLYFPIRSRANPVPDIFNPEGLGALMQLVSGKIFHYRSFFISGSYLARSLIDLLRSSWLQFLILVPVGFYGLLRLNNKTIRNLLIIMLVLISGYTILYNIPDKQGYYLPIFGIWLIVTAVGLVLLFPKRYRVGLFILPAIGLALNYQRCDYAHESSLEDLCQVIYRDLPPNSVIFSDDYFVYYGLLNQEINSHKGIIPICDFYLRLGWYIDQLRDDHSEVGIPEQADRLITACDERLPGLSKVDYGETSKKFCNLIRREIVNANIDQRPIYLYIYHDSDWPRKWLDFYLEYHGLYYQFRRKPAPPQVFPLSLPPPESYRADRLSDEDAITVAKKFGAAFNRRGIYRTRLGDIPGAIKDFDTALRYNPGYYQVFPNLAIAFLFEGDTAKAIENLETYLESGFVDRKTRMIRSLYQDLSKRYHGHH